MATESGWEASMVATESAKGRPTWSTDRCGLVVKMATIHSVLSLALSQNWPILQLDVKISFLNGDLSKTVYMYQLLDLFQCINTSLHNETDPEALNYFLRNAISDPTLYRSLACGSLVALSDVDWAGCPTIKRSTSGYCIFLRDNPLSWSSKRQHILSRSSAEVEYTGHVRVLHVTLRYHYADIFTKGLSSALFDEFRIGLSVRSSPAQTAREC
ncbi:ribonuclease H-like domain-containing protein [Tanacetum coccineum]|uniref:Ribonuclease H-like domain-containing protein n=1 Tax=Tanacetum coccineum TaxID=301880 RepID=A0ABQ4WWC6_9ASTR